MSEVVNKTVVLYTDSYCNSAFVSEVSDYADRNYSRISEELIITLKLLPTQEQINNQVSLLDKEMEEIRENSLRKLEELSLRKQELLAIGYEGKK